uniref:fatty acyl-CoA reductase wat-like isoform X2 n=1 Tax=Vespula vulgaris TaxID=7454 RepID=UPI0021343F8C|nr:fatty acyl-CoA reductase wat-like isoform X2 [Vespula vulgaris]
MTNNLKDQFEKIDKMGRSLQQDGPEIINENNTSMKEMTIKECALTDMKSFVENINKSTPIQNFYDRQSIFITGGTGFIGKLLIEKLLRVCPGIICIYVLIRTKKGKNLLQRIDELVEDPLFATLREEQPKFQNRIIPIEGDCSFPNLGISKTDRNTLIREVSIVFNVAATVKFNEKMKSAIAINVQSLRDLISLSKEMMKLKTFVHVSTAFANCTHDLIGEKFYDSNLDAEQFIDLMNSLNEKLLDDITPQLIGTYPNTYVFTKSMAEIVVKKHVDSIPIGIFRPAIVVPTYREPVPGWIDNLYGPVGITISVLMGLMRVYYCDGSIKANLVPADLTVNGLIVSAWDIANNRRSKEDFPIYNYVSNDNPITYNRFIEMMLKYGKLIPFKKAVWYYSFTITKYRPIYLFCIFFLHLLPALIIDTIAVCVGKQPRLLGIYNKIHQMSDALSYFSTNEWMYINKKWNGLMKKLTSEDRKLFFCDIRELVWSDYFPTYFLGIRKYILKDPIETLPQALIKWQRLYWMHQSLKLVIVCGFLIFIWAVISKFV